MKYTHLSITAMISLAGGVWMGLAIDARADAARWRARYMTSVFEQRDMLTRINGLYKCEDAIIEHERIRALESVR